MAGLIRDSDIATVRERNAIDEIVGEYVALRRAGGGALKGLCPFHDEKTPSFNVRPSHGNFHCFGCNEGGDVIAFLQKIEHLSFVEAVQRLADRIGLTLVYEGGGGRVQRDRGTRTRLVDAHRAAAEFYAERLRGPEAAKAREYLTERGFDGTAAQRFGCGYAPDGWDTLTKYLLTRGFTEEELFSAQLSKPGNRGPIDKFRRRLLWPLKDLGGDVVGFGARRLYDDDPIQAKYLNTSESPIFKKSQVLFGIDVAKREIAKRHQAVVVEGYTDVMAMHCAGVPTAIASCGTAFGTDHISVLRRLMIDDDTFRGEVIFTFDGDEAGKKAAIKAFDEEQRFAAQTYVVIVPDGMDPCDLRLAKGDIALRDVVARRQPLFTFAIRTLLTDYDLDTAEGRVAALRKTVPVVARIKDVALRDEYARQLAGWVGWEDTATVVRRVRETAGGQRKAPAKPAERRPAQPTVAANGRPDAKDAKLWPQRESLKIALQASALAGGDYDAISEHAFTHPAYRKLHAAILAAGGATAGLSGPSFVDAIAAHCEQPLRSLLTELAVEPLVTDGQPDARYVRSVLAKLRESVVAQQIAESKSRLQRMSPVDDADEYRKAFGELVALEQYRKTLADPDAGVG
ncbi:MAG: DNA primase [Sciscionella sp.]|nr:DNA primase [Sciscionella sp.]